MTDIATQLAALRTLRPLVTDLDQGAALDSLIASLEAQLAPSTSPASPVVDRLSISTAPVVGAPATATIAIDGRQGDGDDDVLVTYYQRLVQRCRSMPLQGIYEQRTAMDSLAIDLDRVYTQLATTASTERELLVDAQLAAFNAQAFLTAHTSPLLLPLARRTAVRAVAAHRDNRSLLGLEDARFGMLPDLARMSDVELARLASTAKSLTFLGPQMVSEAIVAAPRLVLLGEPGSGKSTALRYVATILADAGLNARMDIAEHLTGWPLGRLLPIFAPLLPLAQRFADDPASCGDAQALWNYLSDHLQSQGAKPGLAAAVHAEVEAGHVLLLLDGLDEVAGADSRHKVVQAVQSFTAHYPACRVVVACRVRAYEGERNTAWQLPGWPTATLADWTLGQMQRFVRAWYHNVAELRARTTTWRDERIASLTRALATREDLQRFGRLPLMMTVMALVHLNDARLPEDRAGLYDRCIDLLLGHWEVSGKDASEYGTLMSYIGLPDADVQSLRPLLGAAAYEAHRAAVKGEVGQLSRLVLRTMVVEELKRRGHPNPAQAADRFLNYTDLRAGLIQASDAGDAYIFPHQTFQEYLAGIALVGGADPLPRILALRNDDRWRRPILLGIGSLARRSLDVPYRLLNRLIESPEHEAAQRAFDLLFAQDIAADIGWGWLEQRDPLFRSLKTRMTHVLATTLGEIGVPARDLVAIGTALALLGDPRPGIGALPPAMVSLPEGAFVPGISADEQEEWFQAYMRSYPDVSQGKLKSYLRTLVNTQSVALSAFAIGRYPITNAQYQQFIDAGGYDAAAPWWRTVPRTWLTRDDGAIKGLEEWQRRKHKDCPEFWDVERFGCARPNHPVVGISWYEATAFCRWLTQHLADGAVYRLPSAAEWEYAARGTTRRGYPWGDASPNGTHANFDGAHRGTTAVGCFPAGATPEGVMDLAGNVWEWTCSEQYTPPYTGNDGREQADNPAHKSFMLRGGGWLNRPLYLRASYHNTNAPEFQALFIGFRIARFAAQ